MTATDDTKTPAATTPAPAKPARKAPVKAAAKKAPAKAVKAPAAPKATKKPAAPAPKAKPAKAKPAANAALRVAPLGAEPATAKAPKVVEPKKTKLVRDSFTIPRAEYQLLQDLKERATTLGRPAKKSEVLRAGIMTLAALDDVTFTAALAAVPVIKTGRPAKG